jgi:hypothetical protein
MCLVLQVLYFFIADLIIVVIVFYCVGATGALHHLLCIIGATLFPSLHRQVYNLPYFGNVSRREDAFLAAAASHPRGVLHDQLRLLTRCRSRPHRLRC